MLTIPLCHLLYLLNQYTAIPWTFKKKKKLIIIKLQSVFIILFNYLRLVFSTYLIMLLMNVGNEYYLNKNK